MFCVLVAGGKEKEDCRMDDDRHWLAVAKVATNEKHDNNLEFMSYVSISV